MKAACYFVAACTLACGGEMNRYEDPDGQVDGDAMPAASPFSGSMAWEANQGIPPWHMWGSLETVTIPIEGAAQVRQSKQLSRVSYKRPETWHWLFSYRIVSAEDPPLLSYGWSVRFNVTIGVGRASVTLPSFWVFSNLIAAPATVPVGQVLWSTVGIRPAAGPAPAVAGEVAELVAQDIQVSADVALTSAVFPLQPLVLELGSFWAPKNHIRPDWFNNFDGTVPQQVFGGGETGGR